MAGAHSSLQADLDRLIHRLKGQLSENAWADLETFVVHHTEMKFNSIYSSLDQRYDLLKREVYDRLADEESNKQLDAKEIQRRFLEIANPKDMYNDLCHVFQFDNMGTEYENFLYYVQKETYGHLFQPLSLSSSVYQQLSAQVMNESAPAFRALEVYGKQVREHIDLLKREQSAKGFRFITKMVAKGVGLVTFGPFGSIGAGILMNAFFDPRSAIGQSITNVEDKLFSFLDELNDTLENMEIAYQYILLSLYGGAMMKVNQVLKNFHLEVYSLNFSAYEFIVGYTGREAVNFSLWAERQVFMIKRKIAEEKWREAHVMTDRFYHYVSSQPGAFPMVLKNGRSAVRESFLLKYAVISKIAEMRKVQNGKWLTFVQEMFKELPFMVRKEEAVEYDVKSPAEWGMLLLQQAIQQKDSAPVQAYLDYTYRLVKRREQEWKIPLGEELEESEIEWNMLFGFVLADFFRDKWKGHHPIQAYSETVTYEKEWLKFFRKWYIEVTESKDRWTRYLSLLIQATNLSYIVVPTVQFIKKAGQWLYSHRKPIFKTSLSASVILLAAFGAFQVKDSAVAFFQNLNFGQENSEVTAVADEGFYQTLLIQVDGGANVRSEPSLNGAILFALPQGKEVSWFGEEAYEEGSGNWYYIESEQGEGWINEIVLSPSNEQHLVSNGREDEPMEDTVASHINVGETEQPMDEAFAAESTLMEEPRGFYPEGDSVEVESMAPDTEMTSEESSEGNPAFYRLASVNFGHAGASFQANLDERMDIPVEYPYSISITQEIEDVYYVRSNTILERKPQNLWATSIVSETYQLVAVAYEDETADMDIFLIDSSGVVENNKRITASAFSEAEQGFIYIDSNTGVERLLSVESSQLIDREY